MVIKHGGRRHAHGTQYCHVTSKYYNEELQRYSVSRVPDFDQSTWQKKIDTDMFRVDENASGESKKPNHVRRLNFGQSILTLDGVKRFQGQKDRALWLNSNLPNIPCVAKDDLVRKWIEAYDSSVFDGSEKSSLSPILGLSATQAIQTSPVFGKQGKRGKRKGTLPLTVCDAKSECANTSNRAVLEEIPSFLTNNDKCPKVCDDHRKGNVKRNLFDSPPVTVPSSPIPASVSPVLRRNSNLYRRREKIFNDRYSQRQLLDCFKGKCTEINTKSPPIRTKARTTNQSPILGREFHSRKGKRRKLEAKENLRTFDGTINSCIDSNMNSVVSPYSTHLKDSKDKNEKANVLDALKSCALLGELRTSFKQVNLNSLPFEDSNISEESVRSHSSLSKGKLKIEGSPKRCAKDPVKMEIRFSSEDDDDGRNVKDINSDTEQDFSDHIEDTATQDLVALATVNNHISADYSACIRPKSVIFCPQRYDIDSDRTFFPEAEQFRYTTHSVQSSPKISHISSQVTDNRDNKSNQSGIIVSTETSPRRANTDLTAQLTVMDSGKKKRRKPKRGSLVEKLQSAINRRVSFVRTWKHQLKQTLKQNTSVPCVTIFVQRCTIRFGRQFLEGMALEDRFNLLPLKGASVSNKCLTIMTIPEVTGTNEVKSEGLIQIFPPWETLDTEKLVLNVTYIRTIPNDEITAQRIKLNIRQIKRSILKEFHCPCISANNIIPSCKNRTNKPNVIVKLMC